MKKYVEILKEIKNARAAIKDTAATEKEMERAIFRGVYRNGSDAEIEKARAAMKAAEAKYKEECEHNEAQKITIEILKDNAARALFAENIAKICGVWNKYENKPHGEKTAQKIRDEIKKETGLRVYIGNQYDNAHIKVYFDHGSGAPFDNLEFGPFWNGEKQPALRGNKVVKLDPEGMRVCYRGEYVEDVAAHVAALKEAHAAAMEAEEALEEACSKYNALTRGSISQASRREGVKKWYI